MKNQINPRPGQNPAANPYQRPAGPRLHTAKTIAHRHARRKLREQLRRADVSPEWADEIFA